METLAERDLERMGKDGPDTAPAASSREITVGQQGPTPRRVEVPAGVDPGFGYTPGRSRIESVTPQPIDNLVVSDRRGAAASGMPDPRPQPGDRLMRDDLDPDTYVDAFLGEFGAARGDRLTLFEDVAGEMVPISDALFRTRDGNLKVTKQGRQTATLLLADTLRQPDEIWEDAVEVGGRIRRRRRYVGRHRIEGHDVPAVVVFELGRDGWAGVTAHNTDDSRRLENRSRVGRRVYRRKE